MIERDNCFPNVAYILRSNMHRFERFSNEGSPRREKYLKLRAKEGEERLARAWVINGIDHAPMARSNGGRRVSRVRKREREGKTFGNLLDLAQRIDICSWNVLEAKVSPGKI